MKRLFFIALTIIALPLFGSHMAYIFSPGSEPNPKGSNTNIVESFYDAFERNDVSDMMECLSSSYTVKNVASVHQLASSEFDAGSPNLKTRLTAYHEAFPNLAIKIEQMVSTSKKVVAQVSMTGIQKGSFFGISPTERYITIHTIAIFTISDGKIVHIDEILSEYNLMRQLGYIAI